MISKLAYNNSKSNFIQNFKTKTNINLSNLIYRIYRILNLLVLFCTCCINQLAVVIFLIFLLKIKRKMKMKTWKEGKKEKKRCIDLFLNLFNKVKPPQLLINMSDLFFLKKICLIYLSSLLSGYLI